MTTATSTGPAGTSTAAATSQVYRVYIKATPEAVWTALTDPEWTNRYGYTGYAHYDLRPGGAMKVVPNDEFRRQAEEYSGTPLGEAVVDGEVLEVDPPRRLVTTWRMLMDPDMAAEGFTRITYDIKPIDGGCTSLTVTHDVAGAPRIAAMVSGANEDQGGGGGHAWILSDLKSLLETGHTLAG